MTSLSVLVPVYNEQHLVAASLARLRVLETSPHLERVQVVVVDDCSTDNTPAVLSRFIEDQGLLPGRPGAAEGELRAVGSRMGWRFVRHPQNAGKGRAVRTALALADCELSIIHDADLEYHPRDMLRMVKVFQDEGADAVFGSRFAGSEVRRVLFFRHELGNKLLTFLTNLVTNLNVTDVETCYKAVRTDLLRSIPLVSDDFRLEPELTIKLAKRDARLFEVPISYSGRTYQEGKKITWRDGVVALLAIARFACLDHVYASEADGAHLRRRLARAPRFMRWLADALRPSLGERVLEIGAGSGELSRRLIPRRRYVATERNPLDLASLEALRFDRPYFDAHRTDVTDPASLARVEGPFDTILCLNVLEQLRDDWAALANLRPLLAHRGRVVLLLPHGPRLFGSLDRALGRQRRYSEAALYELASRAGFGVRRVTAFNRVGALAWWLNGRLLGRRTFGRLQVALLNLLTPLFRRIDRLLPLPALSLIAELEPLAPARAGEEVQSSP